MIKKLIEDDKKITDIYLKTGLELDDLTAKLGLKLEEFDFENVSEWAIAYYDEIKLDICREHNRWDDDDRELSDIFTTMFRIDELKKPFTTEQIDHFVAKLKSIGISPVYLGECRSDTNDEFQSTIAKIIE